MASTQEPYADAAASDLHDAIAPVAVLDADLPMESALAAMAGWEDDATVVVVDRVRRPWVHVPVPVALVRAVAAEAGTAPDARLRSAVVGWPGAPVVEVADLATVSQPGTVVTLGEQVIGLVTSLDSDRSVDWVPPPGTGLGDGGTVIEVPGPWGQGGLGEPGDGWVPGSVPGWDGTGQQPQQQQEQQQREEPPLPAPPPATPVPGPTAPTPPAPTPATSPTTPTPTTGRLRAVPLVVGPPDLVPPLTPVLLDVGFANPADPTRQPPADADPIHLAAVGEQVTFEIKVTGFGLTFPDGTSHTLTVPREAPWATTAPIPVSADAVPVTTTRTVDLLWFHQGVQVGASWCDLRVAGPDDATPLVPATPEPLGGSTGLDPALAGVDAPDLTVTVISQQGSPNLLWQFGSPHPLPVTTGPVTSAYPAAEAKLFAAELMTQLEAEKGRPTLDPVARSQGAAVTGVLPIEFLRALEAAWAGARAAGREVPTMLLNTDEPWVPWELAWLTPGSDVDPALLPPGSPGVQLGVAWSIGRWPRATRRNHGPALPLSPPARRVDRAPMAVVVADYTGGVPTALPHAVHEGTTLVDTYLAQRVEIDDDSFTRLMLAQEVDPDGHPFRPHLVHITAHGDTTVGKNDSGGIKLKSGRFYSQAAVATADLGRTSSPLVFVNACRVGTAGNVLNTYGGLPGAFIASGCRGFIAPLWKVDDDLAAELSLAFYQQVLHPDPAQRVPVGEAVRRIREAYADGARGTATPLAYVFYGHPLLRLDEPGAALGPTPDPSPDPTPTPTQEDPT